MRFVLHKYFRYITLRIRFMIMPPPCAIHPRMLLILCTALTLHNNTSRHTRTQRRPNNQQYITVGHQYRAVAQLHRRCRRQSRLSSVDDVNLVGSERQYLSAYDVLGRFKTGIGRTSLHITFKCKGAPVEQRVMLHRLSN